MLKFLLLNFLILFCCRVYAHEQSSDFAYSPQWLSVVHYQKKILGYEATIGSEAFYLSPSGQRDPQKELEATVELFQNGSDDVKCLFPARYLLLKKNGLIDEPFPVCKDYEQFKADLQPSGVTLLFTDAYMNNSSSLFGHTLFRIDTARKGTQLLAHGINYGAWTEGFENSFFYALYGLAGFYQGGFTTKPYYDIINTYNNLENRDIWEYNLNLTDEELHFLVAHVWEVGQTATPYYFLTQNCSYMLMEVLDAVRPDLQLAKSFKMQTIPLDTVKAVVGRPGLVKSINYRPSRQRKIQHRIKQMNAAQRKAFTQTAQGNMDALALLPDAEQADVLETAYQYVQYKYVARDLPLADYRRMSFGILKARNGISSGLRFNELKEGQNPVNGHDSMQVSAGIGTRNGEVFEQFSFRPAYHSLIDYGYGFLPGAEINFLDFIFRHYDHHDRYVLQQLNVLQLSSLMPIDEIFQGVSYRVGLDVSRWMRPSDGDETYVLNGTFSGGGTYEVWENMWVYALGGFDAAYGGALPRNQWVGLSMAGGMLLRGEKASLQAEAKRVLATAKNGSVWQYKAVGAYYLRANTALEASFSHTQNYGRDITETCFKIKQYF